MEFQAFSSWTLSNRDIKPGRLCPPGGGQEVLSYLLREHLSCSYMFWSYKEKSNTGERLKWTGGDRDVPGQGDTRQKLD